MLLPACPRCGNKLPIGAFLIRPKEQRFKMDHLADAPMVQCDKCKAAIRTNPKVYSLIVTVWIIVGGILLAGVGFGKLTPSGFLILTIIFGGGVSLLMSWQFLEIVDQEKREK